MAQGIMSTLLNIQEDVSLDFQHPDFSKTLGVTLVQQHCVHGCRAAVLCCVCGYGDMGMA